MKLSKLGVWASMDAFTAREAAAFAQRVEGWGYGALWIPEAMGRNSLVHAAWLLTNPSKLVALQHLLPPQSQRATWDRATTHHCRSRPTTAENLLSDRSKAADWEEDY